VIRGLEVRSVSNVRYEKCEVCHDLRWFDGDREMRPFHRCDPLFRVWCPELGQEEEDGGKDVRASGHERAVETWASWCDSQGDYEIVGGAEYEVWVRKVGEEKSHKYTVTGRSEPVYEAREVKDGKSKV